MVSIGNDYHYDLFDEIDEKPTVSEIDLLTNNYNSSPKSYPIIKTEEPFIEVKEEAGEPDPLLIDETFKPPCSLVVSHCIKPLRTYSRVTKSKRKDEVKKVTPQIPLENLVIQTMEALDRPKGHKSCDIGRWLNSKYGTNFTTKMITAALQIGISRGAIARLYGAKRKKDKGRFILPKYDTGHPKPIRKTQRGFRNRWAKLARANAENAENSTDGIVDTKPLVNGQSGKIAQKIDPPIRKDKVELMVLHSIYSSPGYQGMSLYEIAEFIHNFYDIDSRITLPYIEKYLDHSVEKKILFKKGEKYKRAIANWNSNSKGCPAKQVKWGTVSCVTDGSIGVGNKATNNKSEKSFFADVQLEPEKVTDSFDSGQKLDRQQNTEINTNNNVIQSIDDKQKVESVTQEKTDSKKENSSSINSIPISERRRRFPRQIKSIEQKVEVKKIVPPVARRKGTIKEQQSKLKTVETSKDPFITFARRKLVPFSFEQIRTIQRQSMRDTSKANLTPQDNAQSFRYNQAEKNKSESDLHGTFDEPTYTLAEMTEYIARYPKIFLDNPVTVMWDLSWEEIPLTGNVPCLKLTGIGISRCDNPNCEICGFEFKFGSLICDFCFFEQENILEKCNICDLLCNRADVFHNHFLWEHRPLIQTAENLSVCIAEKNFEKLLGKLAPDNLFCCAICRYLTDNIEVFESHLLSRHASKMNVLPPLPEEEVNEEMVIFRSEITNLCCLRCNECGFISNRKDFMVFHILEIHDLDLEKKLAEILPPSNIEPKNKDESGKKVKWSFGQCHICGNLYNNILLHLKRHRRMKIAAQIEMDTNANKSAQNPDEALMDTLESLPLADRIFMIKAERPRRRRKKNAKRSYLCPICGKLLKRRLGEHLRIHNPQMHKCNVCGKQFNRYSNLLTHKRVHTREKPFQCDICKMTFGYKCSIKGHIVNVHSETVR